MSRLQLRGNQHTNRYKKRFVSESISYLEEHPTEEDRIEGTVGHTEIRVWHTVRHRPKWSRNKIVQKGKFHLGYKAPWETAYHETSVDNLIEHIMQHRY